MKNLTYVRNVVLDQILLILLKYIKEHTQLRDLTIAHIATTSATVVQISKNISSTGILIPDPEIADILK